MCDGQRPWPEARAPLDARGGSLTRRGLMWPAWPEPARRPWLPQARRAKIAFVLMTPCLLLVRSTMTRLSCGALSTSAAEESCRHRRVAELLRNGVDLRPGAGPTRTQAAAAGGV